MSEIPNEKRIQYLSSKWMDGTITEKEKQEYDLWFTSFNDHEINDLSKEDMFLFKTKIYKSLVSKQIKEEQDLKTNKKKVRTSYLVAACISFFVLIGSYIYFILPDFLLQEKQSYSVIKPGKDKAILIFGDGVVYDLDSLENNTIVQDNGIRIEKTNNGELKYSLVNYAKSKIVEPIINIVTTPSGGQYRLLLPDGSKVWLNAASSLKFTVPFNNDNRAVELMGEAYFEVTKNQKSPFSVFTTNQRIEVLGTSFNVNAYEDEVVSTTTLVEGKVKISTSDNREAILSPGEQGIVQKNKEIKVNTVDIQGFTAWKNGEFMFNNESIGSLTRKVARWYDVEFIFEANVQQTPIWGSVSRYEDIQNLLNVIELTGAAHFRIEGRRVYVMK